MIVSTNVGGLCNRLKSLVSCIRYADENNIDCRVLWEKSGDYSKRSHLLNCEFNKLFENDIAIMELERGGMIYKSHCFMIFESDNVPNYSDRYNKRNAKYTPSDRIRRRNFDHNYNHIQKNGYNAIEW